LRGTRPVLPGRERGATIRGIVDEKTLLLRTHPIDLMYPIHPINLFYPLSHDPPSHVIVSRRAPDRKGRCGRRSHGP
jgi:hypothetical protein